MNYRKTNEHKRLNFLVGSPLTYHILAIYIYIYILGVGISYIIHIYKPHYSYFSGRSVKKCIYMIPLLFVKITYVLLIVSKQMACLCPLPAARIAARRSEFLGMEFEPTFYSILVFGFQVILKTVVGRFGLIFAQIWLVSWPW